MLGQGKIYKPAGAVDVLGNAFGGHTINFEFLRNNAVVLLREWYVSTFSTYVPGPCEVTLQGHMVTYRTGTIVR